MRAILVVSALVGAAASAGHGHKDGSFLNKQLGAQEGLVQNLAFKHRLRVCNAFPNGDSLDVVRGETEKLTDSPMPYRTCKDFMAPLKAGDKLDFKVGQATTGSFSVGELPENDAVLLLVVNRHDADSTAVSFESHVFANLESPQVAIIDTYKGKERANPKIRDAAANHSKPEELRYNSVVAVGQGKYDVELDDKDGVQRAKSKFVALNHESYVVLRTGVQTKNGQSFPEELVVFPQSDPKSLPSKSGSTSMRASLVGFVAAMGVTLMAC